MMTAITIANVKVLELTWIIPVQVPVASSFPSGLKHMLQMDPSVNLLTRTLRNNDGVRARGPIDQRALRKDRTKFLHQSSHHRSVLSERIPLPNTFRPRKIE